MQTTSEVISALGRDSLQSALGLTPASVSDAISDGKFPARWYGPMKALADEKGVDLPMGLFHWRSSVDAA